MVEVALPALVSFRKLGFSIVTATSLLVGFSSVKARFSEALAESPSLSTRATAEKQIKHQIIIQL